MTEDQTNEALQAVADDKPIPNLTDAGRAIVKGRLIKFVVSTCDLGASAPKHMVAALPEIVGILLREF